MSNYYESVYQKRLNRYGLDYQSRIQGQRERNFEDYLYKSIYRVDFWFDGEHQPASLEHYKQDATETIGYLLTRRELILPNGTVLEIESKDDSKSRWLVWWLERVESSGYNRYVILRLTHELSWTFDGKTTTQWAYFTGPGNKTIQDTVQTSDASPVVMENNNLHLFITAFNEPLVRESYFEVKQGPITQAYVIKEFDVNSTPGIAYVSVDPVPQREKPLTIDFDKVEKDESTFWLSGGVK